MFNRLDRWHKTRTGLLGFGLVELAIAYGFISLAIDRGNPLWYLLTLLFLIGFLQNSFKLIGKVFNGGRTK
jgi:hypothetical protein